MSHTKHGRKKGGSNSFLIFIILVLLVILGINTFKKPSSENIDDESEEGYDAVCFVVGNVANSPAPNFSSEKIAEKAVKQVFNSAERGEKPNICMYSATANPYAIEIDKKFLAEKGQNQSAITSQEKRLIRGINEAAVSSPSEGGANYFEAILRSASYLKGTGAENPLIIVYGSGLSDSGTVDFAFDNLLNKKDEYVRDRLKLSNIRENSYSNINLMWLGAGQSLETDSQRSLSENWKIKVQNIYEKALGYVGVVPDYIGINISNNTKSVATDYTVSPTIIPGELKPGITISLNERIAKFEPDLAVLKNYNEVKEKLVGFANEFNSTPNIRLKITGYQTYCAVSKELSLNRANTIRNILVNELNVDASRIVVDGVAGPQDKREEKPLCGDTGVATEHRTVLLETLED